MPIRRHRWSLPRPFSLRETALSHGWFEVAPHYWDDDARTLTYLHRVGRRGLLVLVAREGRRTRTRVELRVSVSAAAPDGRTPAPRRRAGAPSADAEPSASSGPALAALRRVLNLHLDLASFYRLAADYEPTRWVIARGAGRVLRGPELHQDLQKTLAATNIRWDQAVKCLAALARRAPAHQAPDGRQFHAFPYPAEIRRAGAQWLRAHARVGYRAPAMIEAAAAFADRARRPAARALEAALDAPPASGGTCPVGARCHAPQGARAPSPASLPEGSDAADGGESAALVRALRGFRGIGPASAHYLLGTRGRYDRMVIDSAVIAYTRDRWFGGRPPAPAEIERHYARFGPWRALIYWMEFIQVYRRGRGLWAE